ncbi:nucleoside hydrolase [Prodigiosinella confusarubida]|uniref:Nucleoside hydrolase n=1 Tax=Serratia sp. (strain ATCC 39006) TaxID=104623 RepID=A0A2I5TMK2_SERS3|nr:nucleoside hydrolase [Serratia sp. ATCC 39006]AUH01463.1 nucleoside hydrolase [Serratia sp. ATCC 39006]AUH05785.1 nucleoside hydrolase [Serratia sp. ATCC 39006]
MTRRIIIDTDPGVDDAIALWLALASPQLDVLGITVVAGNVPLHDAVTNATKIVSLSGRQGVAIYAGSHGPLIGPQRYGKYAAIGAFSDDLVPDASYAVQSEHAVDFIVRTARQAAADNDPITFCAIGPMTNLALALIQHPDVAKGIGQIVTMSCAFTALGHRVPWAEFNVYADPHAAQRVFSSGIPLVVMPLDMTFQALITQKEITTLQQTAGQPGQAIANLLAAFDRSDIGRLGREGGPIHDATVIAWLLQPTLFAGRSATIGVAVTGETAGYTWADFYGKLPTAPNATVMQSVDEAKFMALLTRVLSHYGYHQG